MICLSFFGLSFFGLEFFSKCPKKSLPYFRPSVGKDSQYNTTCETSLSWDCALFVGSTYLFTFTHYSLENVSLFLGVVHTYRQKRGTKKGEKVKAHKVTKFWDSLSKKYCHILRKCRGFHWTSFKQASKEYNMYCMHS